MIEGKALGIISKSGTVWTAAALDVTGCHKGQGNFSGREGALGAIQKFHGLLGSSTVAAPQQAAVSPELVSF